MWVEKLSYRKKISTHFYLIVFFTQFVKTYHNLPLIFGNRLWTHPSTKLDSATARYFYILRPFISFI